MRIFEKDYEHYYIYQEPSVQVNSIKTKSGEIYHQLLNLDSGRAHIMNDCAAVVWDYCNTYNKIPDILAALENQFNEVASLERDTLSILTQFHENGFLRISEKDLTSDCAIIITIHNHVKKFGLPCVNSVLKQSGKAKIYIYDNETNDPDLCELLQLVEDHPEIVYIRIDDQVNFGGLTGTWNDGIRRARKDGLQKVVLLNHDVIVGDSWKYFITSIQSDYAIYGPLSNRPGGGNGGWKFQKGEKPENNGLIKVNKIMGFCMGFTLGRPELKLFDDWRFFNPDFTFGNNEFSIQETMKRNSTYTRFYVVSNCWVYHHLDMSWKNMENSK